MAMFGERLVYISDEAQAKNIRFFNQYMEAG